MKQLIILLALLTLFGCNGGPRISTGELIENDPAELPGELQEGDPETYSQIGTAMYSDGVFVCESIETGRTQFVLLSEVKQ